VPDPGQHGWAGHAYELTGPDAVTFEEAAEQLSTVLGRPIAFVLVPDDAAITQLVGAGVPEWFATNLVTQFRLLRQDSQAYVQDAVRVVTGREPRTIGRFLHDHAVAFAS
jgi:uncharacterized protein YbjT (DUF2867 family)